MRAIIFTLFFLSGAAGLAYETLWARELSLMLGHSARAYATVIAVFLGGLALGNAALGPLSDRVRSRLRLYGWLELAVGLLGLLTPRLLAAAADGYTALARAEALAGPSLFWLRLCLASMVLLPSTVLMGGTLPALTRLIASTLGELGSAVSWLYFFNSAGAVLGTLAVGFWMIPAFGLDFSMSCVAALNIAIGAVALFLAPRVREPAPAAAATESAAGGGGRARLLYAAVFVSGFVTLAYEIAWTRILALVMGSSVYSFSIMLAAFIGGIALGSLYVALHPPKDPAQLFGLAEIAVALALVMTLPLYPRLPYLFLHMQNLLVQTPETFYPYQALQFGACMLLTLAPAAFIGATLPLATRAATDRLSGAGAKVGRVFAFNTAGNVLGAAAAGLWLLPKLGLKPLLETGMFLNWAVGAVVLVALARRSTRYKAGVLLGSLVVLLASVAGGGAWDERIMTSGPFRLRGGLNRRVISFADYHKLVDDSDVVFYKEDAAVSVAVWRRRADGELSLRLNGKTDASTGVDMLSQVLSGHVPMLLRPESKKIFIVGMGSGITAGAVLRHPIRSLDLAEISPVVAEAARAFGEHNDRALDDPRLRLHLDDAKAVLKASRDRYDLIISEPSNPWIAGIGSLFTVEFYEEQRAHLAEGGLVSQWFHTYAMTDELLLSVLRTFRSVFPHAMVWRTMPGDLVLLGSNSPIPADFKALERRFCEPAVKADLARVKVGRVPTLLSVQVASEQGFARIVDGLGARSRLNEDRFPVLEFQAPKAFYMAAEATLFEQRDQRLVLDPRAELLFSRYLQQRRRPLSREEYADLAAFHGQFSGPFYEAVLSDWLRRHPEDDRAQRAQARLDLDRRRWDEADRRLTSRGRGRRADPVALAMAADALTALYFTKRSMLHAGDPAQPLAALRAAARGAEGARAPDASRLWLEAARLAWEMDLRPAASEHARRALELGIPNDAARAMAQMLAEGAPAR